jgi:predicted nuclease of predicted toxin-antitoxin system
MTLKFLIDVGVGKKVEQWLSASDHDVKTVRALDPKLPDHRILQIAARENRIVVTMDKDFGEMIFRAEQTHAGVLLLRLDDATSDEKVRVVSEIVQNYADKLVGKFSVYQSGRLRTR